MPRGGNSTKSRPIVEKFLSKFQRGGETDCWLWLDHIRPNGYGQFWPSRGKPEYAHRYAYRHFVGTIPDGLTVDHLCKNRACVNPAHMEIVTRGENNLRGNSPAALSARKTHCLHGHPFNEANTHITPSGHRKCRICNREGQARRALERRAEREGWPFGMIAPRTPEPPTQGGR